LHEAYADTIPSDISSAMVKPGLKGEQFVSLIEHEGRIIPLHLDVASGSVRELDEDTLFRLIRCEEETPLVRVDPYENEALYQRYASVMSGIASSKRRSCLTQWWGSCT
jgi:hypothetical protein